MIQQLLQHDRNELDQAHMLATDQLKELSRIADNLEISHYCAPAAKRGGQELPKRDI